MLITKYIINSSNTFIKAQVASIIATLIDFSLTNILTEFVSVWYVLSSSLGTITGGCVNFLLGRYCVFNVRNHNKFQQAKRYVIVWAGSLLLNSLGVYVFTEILKMHYMLSKTLIAIIIGIAFNFYFQKTYVFRN